MGKESGDRIMIPIVGYNLRSHEYHSGDDVVQPVIRQNYHHDEVRTPMAKAFGSCLSL